MTSLRSLGLAPPLSVRAVAQELGMSGPLSLKAMLGLLTKRPVYLVAHRVNDLSKVAAAVAQGANAIECDIQFTDHEVEFVVNHDVAWFPLSDAIKPYLDGVAKIAQQNPHLALVYFDIKDTDPARAARLREIVRTHLTDKVAVTAAFAQSNTSEAPFFLPIKNGVRLREGFILDQQTSADVVAEFFENNGITQTGYANGIFVAGWDDSIPVQVMFGVARKWTDRKLRFVGVWTLGAKSAMRDYLALGVDFILVNDVPAMDAVLDEPAVKQQVRRAIRSESPFLPTDRPGYVLTVRTAVGGATGTDARITFTLVGAKGSVSTTINAYPNNMFESGNLNRVSLIGTDVGAIQKLTLSHDGDGNGPDWTVSTVEVRKTGSATSQEFVFNQEITVGQQVSRTPS